MKKVRKTWQTSLVSAFVIFVIGLGLLLWMSTIYIPSMYLTFLGIPYGTNPEFVSSFDEKVTLFMLGFLAVGMGLGMMFSTVVIYGVEKKALHKESDYFR